VEVRDTVALIDRSGRARAGRRNRKRLFLIRIVDTERPSLRHLGEL
jgi:hypothetical protein